MEGKVVNGSVPSSGLGTFSGLCSIDMGDSLTLGLTGLPAATINTGSLTVKVGAACRGRLN